MRKASSKEEFDKKQAYWEERQQRNIPSSMPPRSEWKSDSKPTSLSDAYAPSRPQPQPQPKRTAEENMALSIGLPPGDRLREQVKREHFGIQTEEDTIAELQKKIAELEKNNA
jgi:hypothetical protein